VSNPDAPTRRLPGWVPYVNFVARPLLAAGVPMGPDVLLTVRGRKTGRPRTTPITLCENGGRRGFFSPFGETHWVRNLRAAGRAAISVGRCREDVTVVELGPTDAAGFIRDVLAPMPGDHALATGSFETSTRSTMTIRSKLRVAGPSSKSTPLLPQGA
jgi:deazaflavin-dependent oxidoreductase (nitroreductase family)